MEKKIKLLFFIKVYILIFLSWIGFLSSNINKFEKSTYKKHSSSSKLNNGTYRLLAKYKGGKNLNILCSKEKLPNNVVDEVKNISINEKREIGIQELSNRSSVNNRGSYKHDKKNKSCMLVTKKYSHLEKKIFKELDFEDFLKNNRTIIDKTYKKIIRKKCGLRLALPVILLLFFSVSPILEYYCGYGPLLGMFKLLYIIFPGGWYLTLHKFLKKSPLFFLFKSAEIEVTRIIVTNKEILGDYVYVESFLRFLMYIVPLIILGFTLILAVVYYHKKVKKYQKIKFRKG
ncbi:fam-l protein [Plasmodium malariae]|uniref:Fam-l protein n=1 Tax=Plasmodium malariae TaxID=5858 RepID=A0A1D3JLY5_PLAMA|nr:fam-l protein [Plasmodium malariae]SBT87561.1 fam-l protein [Plasmodium malariae]